MVKVHIYNTKHITIANIYISPRNRTSMHHKKKADTDIQHCIQYITNIPHSVITGDVGCNDLGLHVVEPSGNKRRLQIEITLILTVCCSSQRVFCLGSVRSDHKAVGYVDDRTGPYQTPAPSDGGRHTSESRAYCQVSLSSMCPIRHQSRSKLPVHQMYWMGAC